MKQKTESIIRNGRSSNILRCMATLFVFLLHGRSYIPKIDELPHLFKWISNFPAWAGVWIFLFLSGYGVGYGFFSGKYILHKNGRISFLMIIKFYIGRFVKIAPIYYIYCFIFELLSGNTFFWNNGKVLLKMITFTFNGNGGISGLGHLWYISLAMQLYIFMPFIYLIINRLLKNKYAWIFAFYTIVFCGVFCRCYIVNMGYDWYTYSYTNCLVNIDLVILGMLTAKIKLDFIISIKNRKLIKNIASLIFVSLVMYNCYIYALSTAKHIFIYRCILPTTYAVCSTLILLLSGNSLEKKTYNFFDRIINSFSAYSYAFYIWHIAVFRYISSTLVQTTWFSTNNAIIQYIAFFSICFVINMLLAGLSTSFNKILPLKYFKFEKKVNK